MLDVNMAALLHLSICHFSQQNPHLADALPRRLWRLLAVGVAARRGRRGGRRGGARRLGTCTVMPKVGVQVLQRLQHRLLLCRRALRRRLAACGQGKIRSRHVVDAAEHEGLSAEAARQLPVRPTVVLYRTRSESGM